MEIVKEARNENLEQDFLNLNPQLDNLNTIDQDSHQDQDESGRFKKQYDKIMRGLVSEVDE